MREEEPPDSRAARSQYSEASRGGSPQAGGRTSEGRIVGRGRGGPLQASPRRAASSTPVDGRVEGLLFPANCDFFFHANLSTRGVVRPPSRCYARRSPVPRQGVRPAGGAIN